MKIKGIEVTLTRNQRGSDTPVKVQHICGAAHLSLPVRGQKDKVLRVGDLITDAESDEVCRIYEADIRATV